jgi:DNA repair protein RadC
MERAGNGYRTIREMADDERPRERLLAHGASVLADAELIAIVLRSGMPGENVMDMARSLFDSLGGLSGLARADVKALQRVKGLGPAKAAQLAAAVELGRRVQQVSPMDRELLTSPEAVFGFLGPRLLGDTKERLFVVSLDTKGRLLGAAAEVSGGVSAVRARPAEVFREPIVLSATSVVLVHNHPSGDPRPSAQDVAVTEELIKAGKLLEIDVLDHVVVGQNSFVSMQREGFAFRSGDGMRGQ